MPGDIFVRRMAADERLFGPSEFVVELSDPTQCRHRGPNVRKDGREVVFSSNRSGGQGSQDIWVATRENGGEAWSQPVNLGTNINTTASESRPAALTGRRQRWASRERSAAGGPGDVYITTRSKTSESLKSSWRLVGGGAARAAPPACAYGSEARSGSANVRRPDGVLREGGSRG